MSQQWTLGESIALALVTGFIPALIAGTTAYFAARQKNKDELQKIMLEFSLQQKDQIATLRQQYVTPLSHSARTLNTRLGELEDKFKQGGYEQVRKWFQQLKNHMDSNQRMHAFALWCSYEGIFVTTTLYYTCRYFHRARETLAKSPFGEVDPDYGKILEEKLSSVRAAFGGPDGLWDSSQDVIGEMLMLHTDTTKYADLCRILDSHDEFQYGPLLRPVDFYIQLLNLDRVGNIRKALDGLITFLRSRAILENMA